MRSNATHQPKVTYLLTRRNVYSGRLYADDPAIFSLNLINEPTTQPGFDAAQGVPPGATIAAWVDEMAAHVKSIDANHLLSVGDVRRAHPCIHMHRVAHKLVYCVCVP